MTNSEMGFSWVRLRAAVDRFLDQYGKHLPFDVTRRLREAISQDWFDPQTWKGMWYMLNYTLQYNIDMVKRRFSGEYESDEWGLEREFLDSLRPILGLLYKVYWRVGVTGLDGIPVDGPALLVANQSGILPWDGLMVSTAVLTQHPAQRLVRVLHADWVATLPFVSHVSIKMGQAPATFDNARRLLAQGELVAVFPEGSDGMAKPPRDRYKLAGFGHIDFVKLSLENQAPIIPVAVVGAEDASPTLATSGILSRATGIPRFPITPTFPWLGALGLMPLPTKWTIDFGEPVRMDGYGPDAAHNLVLVSQLTDQVRHHVQDMINRRLAHRRASLLGGAGRRKGGTDAEDG